MKLKIDHKSDALYLRLDDSKIIESEEVAPGVVLDFDKKSQVVGVEVLHLSQRIPRYTAHKRSTSAAIGTAIVREKPSKKYG